MNSIKFNKVIGSHGLLAAGAIIGFTLALIGVVKDMPGSLPHGTVARINDQLINTEEYQSVLKRINAKSNYALTDEDQRQVLDRIIEERLLIQRGRDMGLLESDAKVRKAMVDAVMTVAVADIASKPVTDTELQQFYQDKKAYFLPATQIHIRRLDFRGPESERRAKEALQRLRGEESLSLVSELADKTLIPPPDSPVPEPKLKAYLEAGLFGQLQSLNSGEVSEPIPLQSGYVLLIVIAKEIPSLPHFSLMREQIASVYHREQEEDALQDYLRMLKAEAHIVTE